MSRSRKLGVSAVFLVGILALAASVLRVILSAFNDGSSDATFALARVGISTVGEVTAGILVGNLICLPRFFQTYGPKLKILLRSSNSSSSQSRLISTNQKPLKPSKDKSTSEHIGLKNDSQRNMGRMDMKNYPEPRANKDPHTFYIHDRDSNGDVEMSIVRSDSQQV
ncbi:MAG: hypothetical protein M1822_002580 [Bathelium mastoideum]|nr:MAG: hypothetical protein M1822_002580 [Bathelium mastoideum]